MDQGVFRVGLARRVPHGQPVGINDGLGLFFLPAVALHLSSPVQGLPRPGRVLSGMALGQT